MTTSRREVLVQGAVIGAGVIAANMTGMEAWAQGALPAPKLRRSLHGMALNDPILQTWRDGVRLLKAASQAGQRRGCDRLGVIPHQALRATQS